MSRSWSELPMSALRLTFLKLPLECRAGTVDCVARVCSSWAEAAAAATSFIFLNRCTNIDSLEQWLRSRGANVQSLYLHLTGSSGVITSLPCRQIRALTFHSIRADLRPGSQLLEDLCAATALTCLNLWDVTFQGEPDLAAVLLALPNLREFFMEQEYDIQVESAHLHQQQHQLLLHTNIASEMQVSHAPPQQLLSALGDPLDGYKTFIDSGMHCICKLTKLRGLELGSLQGVTTAGLAGLHNLQLLRRLTLQDLTCDVSLSAATAFSQLTRLTGLALHWAEPSHCEFDPSVLAHTTKLQQLELSAIPACGTVGAAELLFRLSQLPELRELELECVEGLQECSPEALSSLTSSSALERLLWRTWPPIW